MKFKSQIIRLLVFLIILFCADRGLGGVFDKLMVNSKNEDLTQLKNVLNNATADVIVIGDSRAKYHFIPSDISSITGLSCYNMGRKHSNLFFHEFLIDNYLSHRKTKAVVMEILPAELYKEDQNEDGFSSLRPFYGKYNSTIDSCLVAKYPFERFKNSSKIYRFNSMLNVFISDFMSKDEVNERNLGFLSRKGVMKENEYTIWRKIEKKTLLDIDSTKLLVLQRIVDRCKANKVEIIFISLPLHARIPKDSPCVNEFTQFVKNNNIPYLDLSESADYIKDNQLFSDNEHLNGKGAALFSKKVGYYINALKVGI